MIQHISMHEGVHDEHFPGWQMILYIWISHGLKLYICIFLSVDHIVGILKRPEFFVYSEKALKGQIKLAVSKRCVSMHELQNLCWFVGI